MPLEHDTVISLIDLAKVAVTAVVSAGVVTGGALKVRSGQNTKMRVGLMRELDKRLSALTQQVVEIKQQVRHLENSHKITQDLIVVHADHIKEGNLIAGALTRKINEVEDMLPPIQDTMARVENFFERAKNGSLKAEPIEGSGGLVAIKEEDKP